MLLVEPCCAPKHILALRNSLGDGGTAFWHGCGDLSMAELLPAILTRYSEAELLIAAPALPDETAELLLHWLRKQWMRMDGKGKMNAVARLTLVTDLRQKKSPVASTWLTGNPYPERLILRNRQQNDTAIVLPDIAFVGPVNLTYGGHFTAIATKNAATIAELRMALD